MSRITSGPGEAEDLVAALQRRLRRSRRRTGRGPGCTSRTRRRTRRPVRRPHRGRAAVSSADTLPATRSSIWGSSVSPAHLGKIRVRVAHESSPDHDRRADWRSMSTKTDSLAAGRGPLTRVSRDLSWFDPAPSWRRAADLVVGVARSAPSGAAAIGVPVGEKGAVPRQLGVDRATLDRPRVRGQGRSGLARSPARRCRRRRHRHRDRPAVADRGPRRRRGLCPRRAEARGAGDESARGRRRRRRGRASRRRGHRARPLPLRVAEVQRRTGASCSR